MMTQQLYAKIKKNSKYFYQSESLRRLFGWPFPVEIVSHSEYCVTAGSSSFYRLRDVNLFIIENGVELRIT